MKACLRPTRSLLCAIIVCRFVLAPIPILAEGARGAVATVHPLATEAAWNAMDRGGNAVDAAVAAALTLGVVDGFNSGIGGGCFFLARLADGKIVALDGRETAPAAATREMYVRDDHVQPKLSQTGPLAVAVPGALAVYEYAIARHGRLSFQSHLLNAAKIAEEGFVISDHYARKIADVADDLVRSAGAFPIFFNADGSPKKAGEILKQRDLATTYRAIARDGSGWFYKGEFAARVDAWMKRIGGIMTADDLANYRFREREPLRATYRNFEIIGFPPPSSGGVHVAQILNLLEPYQLSLMGTNSADFIHITAEAMKLAFADRAYWLGDPDFTPVPRQLVSKSYSRSLGKNLHPKRVSVVKGPGRPDKAQSDVFGKHTTHISTADADGNWVACTATINTTFGSKVVLPGTGVILNNEMDDFSIQPGLSNYFGLVGSEANAIAPGKRPLSSMSPTIVLERGRPVLATGAAGGPTIISQTVLSILWAIDLEFDPQQALSQGRFHHQWSPDELRIEKSIPESVRTSLEERGHKLNVVDAIGASQTVARPTGSAKFSAAADPRVPGSSAVVR